jgi:L-fuculose-phosphate aldolase
MIISQFQAVGQSLFARGLISSHSGNLSIRLGDRLFITHRNSMLGCLKDHDLIETGISRNDRSTPLASTEINVHRCIYRKTPASAIVHAHPGHAVALSFTEREIKPSDIEGQRLFSSVPVLGWDSPANQGDLSEEISEALKEYKVVLVRGHGSFATGQLLEEAYHYTTALEETCQLLYLLRTLGITPDQP